MRIVDFTKAHVEPAMKIAMQNYKEERRFVSALPPIDAVPDLAPFAHNDLGVAAFDGEKMLGFLCSAGAWDNAWKISGLRKVFSPLHGNGAVSENRAQIYAQMYEAVGEKWAKIGAASHAVCLYAHDKEAAKQFFRYGFGMRCVDAIRSMSDISFSSCNGYTFSEVSSDELLKIYPLYLKHTKGYIKSPFFLFRKPESEEEFLKNAVQQKSIFFSAEIEGQTVAYIQSELDGETFLKDTDGYHHCTGLYCLPEHRGKGISSQLLELLIRKLKTEGYVRLGVDFESINPSGSGFWFKYFDAYSNSLVRRIDECAVTKVSS